MKKVSSFKPAWWLPTAHLQTLWSTLCRRPIKDVSLRRERFELPDGDFIDLDWVGEGKGPIVLLLHGLEGSITSPYAKGMLKVIQQQGWRGLFVHFRGCSEEPNRHMRSYHSGDTVDVAVLVSALRRREPDTQLAAIGFSLGGNVLLKWLGESSERNPLSAAVAISVPFELQKTSARIQKGFSRLYQWHFLRSLREKMDKKLLNKTFPFVTPPLKKIKTVREFDDQFTAPMHGFSSVDDYYARASSRQFLQKIAIPTLLLQAKDDPFMTDDMIPSEAELSASVDLELSTKGGHVGFITGKFPWRPEYWLEKRVPEFLSQYLVSNAADEKDFLKLHKELMS